MRAWRCVGVVSLLTVLSVGSFATSAESSAAAGARSTWLFDMGTADSPLAAGAVRVTGDSVYDPTAGYGWESGTHRSFDTSPPTEDVKYVSPPQTLMYAENVNDLNRDGVADEKDMIFRVDLPDGIYRVWVTIGNMRKIVGSIEVYANGELVRQNVEAHCFRWRGGEKEGYGWYNPVRFTMKVSGGALRLRLHGDDSDYQRLLAIEKTKPRPENFLSRLPGGPKPSEAVLPTDIGQPFVENSILGIEVRPASTLPVVMKSDRLEVTVREPSSALQKAVELFNKGEFQASYEAAEMISGEAEPYAKACLYLWLAGRPELEREEELAPKAESLLSRVVKNAPADGSAAELFWLSQRFSEAARRFAHRFDTGKNAYTEVIAASMALKFLQPDDPMYWKGQIYRGRIYLILNPPREQWQAGAGRDILLEVRKKFPDNRYVRYYVDGVWSETEDWHVPDYSGGTEGAPAWAVAAREARLVLMDMAEWWIVNKQKPDGTLGAGYGDDVELIVDFANYSFVDPGLNQRVLEGVVKLAEGNWLYSHLDTEAGFWWEPADVGHSAEFTADTLPMMIYLEYGNPVWVERSMKSAKLMRDMWTGINPRGHRHFRSNFVGGLSMGGGLTTNDSWANYRAALVAATVLWYNNLPEIARLFDEWAEAMLEDSMKTDRGKPAGVMPSNIAFVDCTLGGVDSPAWYLPNRSPGTVNPMWNNGEDFHYKPYYHLRLLGGAYERSGDPRFLEPFRIEAELARKYTANPVKDPPAGSEAWAGKMLANADAPWEENAVTLWEHIQKTMLPQAAAAPFLSISDAYKICDLIRWKGRTDWPMNTTDALATDRVGFGGITDVVKVFTGGYVFPVPDAKVSFLNAGANFASCVLAADRRHLYVLLYNFDQEGREIGIRPWELEAGARYSLSAGPDEDADGVVDAGGGGDVELRSVLLAQRGEPIYLKLAGRKQIVVRLEQTEPAASAMALTADLAASARDLEYDAKRSFAILTVHNIGAAAADDVAVVLYDGDPHAGGKKIGSNLISHIEPPNDLVPETVRVGFLVPKAEGGKRVLHAVIDPDNEVTEITEFNNTVSASF